MKPRLARTFTFDKTGDVLSLPMASDVADDFLYGDDFTKGEVSLLILGEEVLLSALTALLQRF
jgi:hypothetical protein